MVFLLFCCRTLRTRLPVVVFLRAIKSIECHSVSHFFRMISRSLQSIRFSGCGELRATSRSLLYHFPTLQRAADSRLPEIA